MCPRFIHAQGGDRMCPRFIHAQGGGGFRPIPCACEASPFLNPYINSKKKKPLSLFHVGHNFLFLFLSKKKPIVYNIKGLNFSIFSILVSQIFFVQSSV